MPTDSTYLIKNTFHLIQILEAVDAKALTHFENCVLSRAKKGALEEFASWADRLVVKEAAWDIKAAEEELEAQIDSHTDRLIASKVSTLRLELLEPCKISISNPIALVSIPFQLKT